MTRWTCLVFAWLVLCAAPASASCAREAVTLRGDWGEARFEVELADDPESRARGLMFRESLPRGSGMLFIYERPQGVGFWMKNTLIPLDLLFADPTGTVVHVHHRAQPGDLTPMQAGPDILAVLEINGGLARRYGIGPGSQMRHPVFAAGPAAWPC